MPELSILISTINERILQIPLHLFSHSNVEILIVHQITDGKNYDKFSSGMDTKKVKYIFLYQKGLSLSRNTALQHARGNYFWICDDDVIPRPDFYETILSVGAVNKNVDIYTFRIATNEGKLFKKYPADNSTYSKNSIAKVSSVELVLRKGWWEDNKVYFDTNFGLGSIFETGEEFIFLSDALLKKARIKHAGKVIAMHPSLSSGRAYSEVLVKAKGAMIARVYRRKYVFINFAFALKKYREYKDQITFFQFLKYLHNGSRQYLKK